MLSHGQTVHFRPHSVIYHLKAMHHSFKMSYLEPILVHPVRRQNFGDTVGQTCNPHLIPCLIIAFDHLRCECDIVSSFFDLFRCVDRPSTSSLLLLQSTTSCEHITKITMQIQNWQIQIQNWQIQIQKRLQVYHLQRASSCQRSIFDSQQLVLRLHFLIKGAENYLTMRNI